MRSIREMMQSKYESRAAGLLQLPTDQRQLRRLEEELAHATLVSDKDQGVELTHPDVAELMTRMALTDGFAPTSVLDPAAGYGNFLAEVAAQAKGSLKVVYGWDRDASALDVARRRLAGLLPATTAVHLQLGDSLTAEMPFDLDLVITNPPYVRIQRLGPKRLELRSRYVTAKGRFDIYFLFIELALRALRPGGRLAIITSNKFMTTGAGSSLRDVITRHFSPLRIIDFRDASPFRAAVLASILVLEKGEELRRSGRVLQLTRVPHAPPNSPGIEGLAETPAPGIVIVPRLGGPSVAATVAEHELDPWTQSSAPWHFNGAAGARVLSQLSFGHQTLGDFFTRFSVGIKTTADDVFVTPFSGDGQPVVESELLHPLVRGKSVQRWSTSWDPSNGYDRYVLYPHRSDERGRTVPIELADYPLAARYLNAHRERLASRPYVAEAGRRWYEIWVTQKISTLLAQTKLVFPDFAQRNTFALDRSGAFVGSSAGFGLPDASMTEDDIWYVLFLLNSPVMEYLHKRHFGTSILSGRYRYWVKEVARYPIPWPDTAMRASMAALARDAAVSGIDPPEYLDTALQAFALSASEAAAVRAAVVTELPLAS